MDYNDYNDYNDCNDCNDCKLVVDADSDEDKLYLPDRKFRDLFFQGNHVLKGSLERDQKFSDEVLERIAFIDSKYPKGILGSVGVKGQFLNNYLSDPGFKHLIRKESLKEMWEISAYLKDLTKIAYERMQDENLSRFYNDEDLEMFVRSKEILMNGLPEGLFDLPLKWFGWNNDYMTDALQNLIPYKLPDIVISNIVQSLRATVTAKYSNVQQQTNELQIMLEDFPFKGSEDKLWICILEKELSHRVIKHACAAFKLLWTLLFSLEKGEARHWRITALLKKCFTICDASMECYRQFTMHYFDSEPSTLFLFTPKIAVESVIDYYAQYLDKDAKCKVQNIDLNQIVIMSCFYDVSDKIVILNGAKDMMQKTEEETYDCNEMDMHRYQIVYINNVRETRHEDDPTLNIRSITDFDSSATRPVFADHKHLIAIVTNQRLKTGDLIWYLSIVNLETQKTISVDKLCGLLTQVKTAHSMTFRSIVSIDQVGFIALPKTESDHCELGVLISGLLTVGDIDGTLQKCTYLIPLGESDNPCTSHKHTAMVSSNHDLLAVKDHNAFFFDNGSNKLLMLDTRVAFLTAEAPKLPAILPLEQNHDDTWKICFDEKPGSSKILLYNCQIAKMYDLKAQTVRKQPQFEFNLSHIVSMGNLQLRFYDDYCYAEDRYNLGHKEKAEKWAKRSHDRVTDDLRYYQSAFHFAERQFVFKLSAGSSASPALLDTLWLANNESTKYIRDTNSLGLTFTVFNCEGSLVRISISSAGSDISWRMKAKGWDYKSDDEDKIEKGLSGSIHIAVTSLHESIQSFTEKAKPICEEAVVRYKKIVADHVEKRRIRREAEERRAAEVERLRQIEEQKRRERNKKQITLVELSNRRKKRKKN